MTLNTTTAGALASALLSATTTLAAEPAITPFVNDQYTAVSTRHRRR